MGISFILHVARSYHVVGRILRDEGHNSVDLPFLWFILHIKPLGNNAAVSFSVMDCALIEIS